MTKEANEILAKAAKADGNVLVWDSCKAFVVQICQQNIVNACDEPQKIARYREAIRFLTCSGYIAERIAGSGFYQLTVEGYRIAGVFPG